MPTLDTLQIQLANLNSTDSLRQLFADWSYQIDFAPIFLGQNTKADEKAQESLAADPEVLARSGEFEIIYAPLRDWDKAIGSERLVISRLLNDHPFALWIFSNEDATKWHFVNIKRGGKEVEKEGRVKRRHVLRRISLSQGRKPGRTICERLARLDVAVISPSLFGVSEFQIQAVHDAAFDVESVTAAFYKGYRSVLRQLQERLKAESGEAKDVVWAHSQALQTLNRLMFLRFLEHKETQGVHWLGDDPDFTLNLWKTYRKSGEKNRFYSHWLEPLFFEAFNNSFNASQYPYLPTDTRESLEKAPYLNGGLFKHNDIDLKYQGHLIVDEFFELLFDRFDGQEPGFFERYNFTITEDSPFDQEVAVDPEMIGHVYESLINLSEIEGEETDQAVSDARGDHGIFYTQRVEIDLMGRLTLCDYFYNHLTKVDDHPADLRDLLLEWVFAYDAQEKGAADARLEKSGLSKAVDTLLRDLKVCDPACGSGAFLVGMLAIVDDLQARINLALGTMETPYDRCRRIIGDVLYGVDVMEWAVHVAELRMWLQLLIENDVHPEELNRHYPLLPNLSFKVRHGDSLVQELGGVTLGLSDQISDQISHPLRLEMNRIITKKRKYFQAQRDSGITPTEIEADEKSFFAGVLLGQRDSINRQLDEIEKLRSMPDLMGHLPDAKKQTAWNREVTRLQVELADIQKAGDDLSKMNRPPFVWSLSFPEIFMGNKDKRGFDIVIGNPPYVRQEKIGPPLVRDPTPTQRKKYKDALMRSVQGAWPQYFEGGKRELSRKSDLYIYFYLHGLKLLNREGAFGFITSNSWLDVGYGAGLQEWLLRFGRVRFIFDNEVKRSFKSADVNTAIAIFGRGSDNEKTNGTALARFIMWLVPFEQASNALLWQEIESADKRCERAEFRLRLFPQSELRQEGADPQNSDVYTGNKWGGKYLRAPEIYDVVLEKGKDKLVRLGDVTDVRFGIKTGANEFFVLSAEQVKEWGIEADFLRPIIKSPRECSKIVVPTSDIKTHLLVCHQEKNALKGTAILEYIKWGETQNFHERPSTRGRARWWDIGVREMPRINANYLIDKVMRFFAREEGFLVTNVFHEFHIPKEVFWQTAAAANSSLLQLSANVAGRANFGDGLMKIETYEAAGLQTINPALLDIQDCKTVLTQAERLNLDGEDRHALDEIVFDALELSTGEREAVYEELVNLVSKRLRKAGSLRESQ